MLVSKMSRTQLEVEILGDDRLYRMFDETRLLDGGYSVEDMRAIVSEYVIANNECI